MRLGCFDDGFVREALDFSQKLVGRENRGRIRHITGQELLDGIRQFALQQFVKGSPELELSDAANPLASSRNGSALILFLRLSAAILPRDIFLQKLHTPPKRRLRLAYSSSAAKNCGFLKSGQSVGVMTSSA